MFDLIISNGRVIDGAGNPWVWADVAVEGDRIVAVGKLAGSAAKRAINADGQFVTPGFVDMHTHSDLQSLANPLQECKTRQGITLEVIGQDGLGLAPVTRETAAQLRSQLAGWNGDPPNVEWDWNSVTEYLDRFDRSVAVNIAMLVPHGTVRMAVMGTENRAPTNDELDRMRALTDQCMREGAVGLSTGLTYTPGMYATDDEIVELCRVIRPYGGYYCPHHRNYGMYAIQGYSDSIEIARRAGVPVNLTHAHFGFPVNKNRAPELLALFDAARRQGVDVTLDTYPYIAGATYLHACLPSWAHEGGMEATLARLENPETRARIRREIEVEGSDSWHAVPMDWHMIQIGGTPNGIDAWAVGLRLDDAAAKAGMTPFDYFCDLLMRTRLGTSQLAFIGNEENVQAILQHPIHLVSSDGILVGDMPHPRGWGSHVRFLAHYVRDLGLLTWEEGVRHMTSAATQRLGFLDRGLVRPGMMADLVVFDPEILRDTATYENPRSYPLGVSHVVNNGTLVVENAQMTGATPGRALRSPFGRVPERMTGAL
ncbi:MAG: D-aminoacylase [Anaerolineae bacterium]|nr:D-aminoacylase [Anaerolineae bacterium]